MSVERYTIAANDRCPRCDGDIDPDAWVALVAKDGDYMRHADHEAEVGRLRAELTEYVAAAQMLAVERAEFRIRAERAEAVVAELRPDAERYRYLRESALEVCWNRMYSYSPGYTEHDAEEMDAFIDARDKG